MSSLKKPLPFSTQSLGQGRQTRLAVSGKKLLNGPKEKQVKEKSKQAASFINFILTNCSLDGFCSITFRIHCIQFS